MCNKRGRLIAIWFGSLDKSTLLPACPAQPEVEAELRCINSTTGKIPGVLIARKQVGTRWIELNLYRYAHTQVLGIQEYVKVMQTRVTSPMSRVTTLLLRMLQPCLKLTAPARAFYEKEDGSIASLIFGNRAMWSFMMNPIGSAPNPNRLGWSCEFVNFSSDRVEDRMGPLYGPPKADIQQPPSTLSPLTPEMVVSKTHWGPEHVAAVVASVLETLYAADAKMRVLADHTPGNYFRRIPTHITGVILDLRRELSDYHTHHPKREDVIAKLSAVEDRTLALLAAQKDLESVIPPSLRPLLDDAGRCAKKVVNETKDWILQSGEKKGDITV